MAAQKQVLITDTTMRDGHQSLLATRMRSIDMIKVAPAYAEKLPQLFSVECWGGATFDVAYRFLQECPWQRLRDIREKMPNLMTQMLLRASNGVGYTNYPDNVVQFFVKQAAESGVDVFRVFDSLNWVENMRVAMDAVIDSGKVCEGTICYTGDINDPDRAKYNLKYYVDMGKELRDAGAHVLGLKDMAGLLKPAAAGPLVRALKEEVGLPIHFHTHDTSGAAIATVMAAAEAGVPVGEYSPLEVKGSVVGYGRATKEQVQMMVTSLLRLEEKPNPFDASDALAVAICHSVRSATAAKLARPGKAAGKGASR